MKSAVTLHVLQVLPQITLRTYLLISRHKWLLLQHTHEGLFLWQTKLYCLSQGKSHCLHDWKWNSDVLISVFQLKNRALCFLKSWLMLIITALYGTLPLLLDSSFSLKMLSFSQESTQLSSPFVCGWGTEFLPMSLGPPLRTSVFSPAERRLKLF